MIRTCMAWLLLALALPSARTQAAPGPQTDCAVIPLAGREVQPTLPSTVRSPAVLRDADANSAVAPEPVVRYRIDARLEPRTHTVFGRQQMTWKNRSAVPVCTLYLRTDLNAFAGWDSGYMDALREKADRPEVQPGEWGYLRLGQVRQNGRAVVWMHVQPDGAPRTDRTVTRLDLPYPILPGAETALDIGFTAWLPGAWAETGHAGSFHLVAHWYPRIAVLALPRGRGTMSPRTTSPHWNAPAFDDDAPQELADFDVRLTVPQDFAVGASGEEVGARHVRDGLATQRFVLRHAPAFAWAADARFARPIDYVHTSAQGTPIRIRVLHRREHAAAAAMTVGAMADALGYYASTLQAFPYRSVTAVVAPSGAGWMAEQSHASLLTVPHATRTGQAREDRVELAARRGIGAAYFRGAGGDGIASAPLAGGLIDYWTARMLRERRQRLHAPAWLRPFVSTPLLDGFAALRLHAKLPKPATDEARAAARVALALHDLEARIGTVAIDRAFRTYLDRVAAGSSDPALLHSLLAKESGQPTEVDRVFAQHIERGRLVNDRILAFHSDEVLPQPGYYSYRDRQFELTQAAVDTAVRERRRAWERKQNGNTGPGPFPYRTVVAIERRGVAAPQLLQVTFADGSTRRVRWDGPQAARRFEWITPSRAVSAQLDPQRRVLLDPNKLDDGRSLRADTAPARRWSGDIAAAVQVVSALLVGL